MTIRPVQVNDHQIPPKTIIYCFLEDFFPHAGRCLPHAGSILRDFALSEAYGNQQN
jgi:hypothetical protein